MASGSFLEDEKLTKKPGKKIEKSRNLLLGARIFLHL